MHGYVCAKRIFYVCSGALPAPRGFSKVYPALLATYPVYLHHVGRPAHAELGAGEYHYGVSEGGKAVVKERRLSPAYHLVCVLAVLYEEGLYPPDEREPPPCPLPRGEGDNGAYRPYLRHDPRRVPALAEDDHRLR